MTDSPFIDDEDFTLHVGDVREQLSRIPDNYIHTVVTSPPYWGLRDYGTGVWDGGDPSCDHAVGGQVEDTKAPGAITTGQRPGVDASRCRKCGAARIDHQIGLERTPDEYVRNMVEVFRGIRRVLRDDGTVWLNLGDSYAGSNRGGAVSQGAWDRLQGDPTVKLSAGGSRAAIRRLETTAGKVPPGLKPKDLVGIPWMVAFALRDDGWYLRADVVWDKPNAMPESVTDRPTKAHEYLFLLAKSSSYFYDMDAVREPAAWERWGTQTNGKHEGSGTAATWIKPKTKDELQQRAEQGRNMRSVWKIVTTSYDEAHFAVFPDELPRRCILAGTSEEGCCPDCGAPFVRVTEYIEAPQHTGANKGGARTNTNRELGISAQAPTRPEPGVPVGPAAPRRHLGWRATCEHAKEPVPCRVLDPFLGAGTTAVVARKLGRHAVGIELNPDYAELVAKRTQQLSLLS